MTREQMQCLQQIGLESLTSAIPSIGQSSSSSAFTKYLHCPTPNCKYIFAIDDTDKDEEAYHLRCDICSQHYCLKCNVKYHFGKSCLSYKKDRLKQAGSDDILFLAYIQSRKVKSCPKCGRFVERVSGCSHMSCICGEQFCYICGKPQVQCVCTSQAFEDDDDRPSQDE